MKLRFVTKQAATENPVGRLAELDGNFFWGFDQSGRRLC